MEEKHDGRKLEFEKKMLKSFQHNPLARQCAEAIRIKNTDPNKRINNKDANANSSHHKKINLNTILNRFM